jgi:hypothetical protein
MRRAKSLRNGVHRANAVVWGPVYRTRLDEITRPLAPVSKMNGPTSRPSIVGRTSTCDDRADSIGTVGGKFALNRTEPRFSPIGFCGRARARDVRRSIRCDASETPDGVK